jgi:hypothetical protein
MIEWPHWIEHIHAAWKKRPVVWLAGVRRAGKTTLARMIHGAVYLNCDLPSVLHRLEDPELFYRSPPNRAIVVFDEAHRLPDPARILKIGADAFPRLRLLATGASTLSATRKFHDTLTGRKTILPLPPILRTECEAEIQVRDPDRRLFHGGLPEPLLAGESDPAFYAEWLNSFYTRDILELFGVRERTGFLNLLRLMLRQSGGLVDYSALSPECDLSRATVKSHLDAMAVACALIPVAPFHGGGRRELVRRPKVYVFDTGFVACAHGWRDLRAEDRGPFWEHLALDVLRTAHDGHEVAYWRDKSGREVDFVVPRGRRVDAYECKLNPARFDAESLKAFRSHHPGGENLLLAPGIDSPYDHTFDGLIVRVTGCRDLLLRGIGRRDRRQ